MKFDWLAPALFPVHKEGYRFIAIFAIVTFGFYYYGLTILAFIGIVLTVWCALFFRNPNRITPQGDDLVISPADGVVQFIVQDTPPAELGFGDEKLTRVTVFMNVFNVHINRAPISGTVEKVQYKPGKFLNADLEKASSDNERQSFVMKTDSGKQVIFVQIAGLVARRIMGWINVGDTLEAGDRFGLIRFGSRVDIFLPKGVEPKVCVGQTAIAGETILADMALKNQEPTIGINK